MKPLAVIAGIGGINAAGRSSAHHGYRRSVIDVLEPGLAAGTIRSLAGLMRIEGTIDTEKRRHILEHTLVRGLEPEFLVPRFCEPQRFEALRQQGDERLQPLTGRRTDQ